MKFDPKVTLQAIATLLAVLSAWLVPLVFNIVRNRRKRIAIEDSIGMYLDAFEIKLAVATALYFQPGGRVPSGK